MQQARVLKVIDGKTGRITLCGTGAERLAQATAAGLVSGELRRDVETVRQENARLHGALAASERDRRHEKVRFFQPFKTSGDITEHLRELRSEFEERRRRRL